MKMHCHVFWMLIIVSKASYIFLWQLCPVCNRQVVGLRMSSLCTWRRKAFFKIHTINSFFSSFRFNSKNSLVSFFSIRMCVRLMSSKRRMQDYKKHWIALNIHTICLKAHNTIVTRHTVQRLPGETGRRDLMCYDKPVSLCVCLERSSASCNLAFSFLSSSIVRTFVYWRNWLSCSWSWT